jgi:hypothetical protein
MVHLASRGGVDPASMFSFLVEDWNGDEDYHRFPHYSKIYSSILSAVNYNSREATAAVMKARESLMEKQQTVRDIASRLQKALAGFEIVYLPTYRRVELALRGDTREAHSRRRRPKFDVAAGSLFTGEIQFGLSDMSERLSQLNQQIILESNSGYRKLVPTLLTSA